MPTTDRNRPRLDDEPRPSVHRDELDAVLDRRSELAGLLAAATYPAGRAELLAVADGAVADEAVLEALAGLPAEHRYEAFGEVWQALGGPVVDEHVDELVDPGTRPTGRPAANRPARRPARPAAIPSVRRFDFAFEPLLVPFALVVGVTPRTAWVELDAEGGTLEVRFGPWVLRTDLANVAGAEVSGPYHLVKVAGPPHLSLADRGVTFATTRRRGVCLRFHEPVPGALPGRLLPHPGATVTVADPEGLVAAIASSLPEA